MTIRLLFYPEKNQSEQSIQRWREAFLSVEPTLDFRVWPDWGNVDEVPAYCFVWQAEDGIIASQTNIAALFSMGAGVDGILRDPTIPEHLPIYRLADTSLKEDMADYVQMAVLMMHRRLPEFLAQQKQRLWKRRWNQRASELRVGVMGYGELGRYCVQRLLPMGYQLAVWSRTGKTPEANLEMYCGEAQFGEFLACCDILVSLLPHSEQTTGLLNLKRLQQLPEGASLINVGRGSLIPLDDLATALDEHLAAAMLDVMPSEPLPQDHPIWLRDDVMITPHVAAITRPDSAAAFVVRAIRELEETGSCSAPVMDRMWGY